MQKGIEPAALAAVAHSEEWTAHVTNEDKIYYVNTQSKGMQLNFCVTIIIIIINIIYVSCN